MAWAPCLPRSCCLKAALLTRGLLTGVKLPSMNGWSRLLLLGGICLLGVGICCLLGSQLLLRLGCCILQQLHCILGLVQLLLLLGVHLPQAADLTLLQLNAGLCLQAGQQCVVPADCRSARPGPMAL